MNIPNFVDSPMVDENGRITSVWKNILIQLFTELQTNIGTEGISIPELSQSEIDTIGSKGPSILYNSDSHKLMVCLGGIWKEILTS